MKAFLNLGKTNPHLVPDLPGTFEGLLVLRAVQLAEQDQPLDDVQAMREAYSQFSRPQDRLFRRAVLLAKQVDLDNEIAHWREWLVWICFACALLVATLSYSLIGTVVGGDRRINAVGALAAVLGPHLISLTIWMLALIFGTTGGGLPQWILSASTRMPGLKRRSSRLLLDAGLSVLGQSRGLLSWAFGSMMHAIWAMAFVLTIIGLFLAFSFLAFRLTWETTILSPEVLARFAQITGSLPQLLGFTTPNVANVLSGEGDHRGWALWLIGCTLVYGFGLRVLVGVISGTILWRALSRLQVDTRDPYIRTLLHRFESLNAVQVIDTEHRPQGKNSPTPSNSGLRAGWAMIGFELPESQMWPLVSTDSCTLQVKTDGSALSKRSTLAQLHLVNPQRLIFICNGAASPDRATERFLREASSYCDEFAVLLLRGDTASDLLSADRWLLWLRSLGWDRVFNNSPTDAIQWAKESHVQGD